MRSVYLHNRDPNSCMSIQVQPRPDSKTKRCRFAGLWLSATKKQKTYCIRPHRRGGRPVAICPQQPFFVSLGREVHRSHRIASPRLCNSSNKLPHPSAASERQRERVPLLREEASSSHLNPTTHRDSFIPSFAPKDDMIITHIHLSPQTLGALCQFSAYSSTEFKGRQKKKNCKPNRPPIPYNKPTARTSCRQGRSSLRQHTCTSAAAGRRPIIDFDFPLPAARYNRRRTFKGPILCTESMARNQMVRQAFPPCAENFSENITEICPFLPEDSSNPPSCQPLGKTAAHPTRLPPPYVRGRTNK